MIDRPVVPFVVIVTIVSLAGCGAPPSAPAAGVDTAKRVVVPNPNPPGWLSPAVQAGHLVFLSGQLGREPGSPTVVAGGIGPETEQAMRNIEALLTELDLGLDDVVKCTVFLADFADYGGMNEVYMRYFDRDPPARSALAVDTLARDARVEIECIATRP